MNNSLATENNRVFVDSHTNSFACTKTVALRCYLFDVFMVHTCVRLLVHMCSWEMQHTCFAVVMQWLMQWAHCTKPPVSTVPATLHDSCAEQRLSFRIILQTWKFILTVIQMANFQKNHFRRKAKNVHLSQAEDIKCSSVWALLNNYERKI